MDIFIAENVFFLQEMSDNARRIYLYFLQKKIEKKQRNYLMTYT